MSVPNKETEKIFAQNVEMWYDARCKVHNQEFTALYMTPGQANPALHEEMRKFFTPAHLEKGAPGWRGVKGWPGYRVNANRNLFVDGLTRAGKPTRVDGQPGLV
jgi:hypothetical protein